MPYLLTVAIVLLCLVFYEWMPRTLDIEYVEFIVDNVQVEMEE